MCPTRSSHLLIELILHFLQYTNDKIIKQKQILTYHLNETS